MSIYAKQLEDENERLRQMLSEAQYQLDRQEGNPLRVSLELLIDASLKHQKKVFDYPNKFIRWSELVELKIDLPRQIGLSTSIVQAAAKFFTEVDILHPYTNLKTVDSLVGNCVVRHHASVNNFIGRKVSCVIVDPWSVMYGGVEQRWQDIKDKIMSRFDNDKLNLLIMVG